MLDCCEHLANYTYQGEGMHSCEHEIQVKKQSGTMYTLVYWDVGAQNSGAWLSTVLGIYHRQLQILSLLESIDT